MDQQNPGNDWGGTGSTGSIGGTGTTGTTGSTGSGTTYGTSGTGSTDSTSGFNVSSGTDTCPTCGRTNSGGLEQFLSRLGITEDMIGNLKGQFQNVDIDEYLNTARTYLKDGSGKATAYAKENPGKVAAGVAALALGAGLLYAASNRDKA
ncbi:MAG TPA: hypothetical protein VNI54_16055 [Thermoanaerobaculia bacterium]|nr:hypothetical protein [Thermoanaerobaculia bacterium]